MTTATSGKATITFGDAALLRTVDQVSGGAASSFLETVRPTLARIMETARSRWPVRTGLSRDEFQLAESVTDTEVRSSIVNPAQVARWGYYAYKIHFSRYTSADLTKWIEEREARGTTPENQARIRAYAAIRSRKTHGRGAPDEASVGKNVWSIFVRKPAKDALSELLPKLRADLDRLAGV